MAAAQVHGAEVEGGGNRGHGAVRSRVTRLFYVPCPGPRRDAAPPSCAAAAASLPQRGPGRRRRVQEEGQGDGRGPQGKDRMDRSEKATLALADVSCRAPHQLRASTPVPQAMSAPAAPARTTRRRPGPGSCVLAAGRRTRRRCSRRAGTVRPAPGPAAARPRCWFRRPGPGFPQRDSGPTGASSHQSSPTGMPAAAMTAALRHGRPTGPGCCSGARGPGAAARAPGVLDRGRRLLAVSCNKR